MKQQIAILRSAIIAGICISIGCVVNLRVGGVAGAVLFAFGLFAILYRWVIAKQDHINP